MSALRRRALLVRAALITFVGGAGALLRPFDVYGTHVFCGEPMPMPPGDVGCNTCTSWGWVSHDGICNCGTQGSPPYQYHCYDKWFTLCSGCGDPNQKGFYAWNNPTACQGSCSTWNQYGIACTP